MDKDVDIHAYWNRCRYRSRYRHRCVYIYRNRDRGIDIDTGMEIRFYRVTVRFFTGSKESKPASGLGVRGLGFAFEV